MFINPTVVLARMGNVSGILVGCSTRVTCLFSAAAADLLGSEMHNEGGEEEEGDDECRAGRRCWH